MTEGPEPAFKLISKEEYEELLHFKDLFAQLYDKLQALEKEALT